jgi:glutathione S-transferase
VESPHSRTGTGGIDSTFTSAGLSNHDRPARLSSVSRPTGNIDAGRPCCRKYQEIAVITLYAFGRVYPGMAGEGRDLRAQWALEETGLPYRVHALDYVAGEFESPAFSELSCFRQVPVIDDEGFVVSESGAVLLYIAEKAGTLIPADFAGRTRVVQWCFAALATVEPPLFEISMIDVGIRGKNTAEQRASLAKDAGRRFEALERRLDGREWIACGSFTVADILLATVLRQVRHTDLIEPYPRLKAYYARALARPAWQRTLSLCAERQGASVTDFR